MAAPQGEARMLIDGELVDASDGATFDNINPATEEVLGVAADATIDDVTRAVAAARRAFDTTDWSTNRDLRARCLEQLKAALEEAREELRRVIVAEAGSPVALTYVAQLDEPINAFGFWIDLAKTYEFEKDLGNIVSTGLPSRTQLRTIQPPTGSAAASENVTARRSRRSPFQNRMNRATKGSAKAR